MKLAIIDADVRVECSQSEFLKLKTALVRQLGNRLRSENYNLYFPLNAISLVRSNFSSDVLSPDVEKLLDVLDNHTQARELALKIVASESAEDVPADWLNILDPGQAYAAAAMTVPGLLGLCLFDEQGSGKTVMTIAAFDILKMSGEIDAMIVICPKTMMSEWSKDINKLLPGKYDISVAIGSKRDKYLMALRNFDIFITNYEGVGYLQVALAATAARRRYVLAVDESYYVKNKDAIRSESARKLRSVCSRCYVICGTPVPNSPYDLVNQFDMADNGFTFAGFNKTDDENIDQDIISNLIESRGTVIRRMKAEILKDIPDKYFHVIGIPLKGRQALLYERARSDLELELLALDNTKFRRNLFSYFQRRSALLQICANPAAIDPTISDVPVKYEYLDDLLDKLTKQGRKVILWSFYTKSIDDLMIRYVQYNPARVDGSVESSNRTEAVRSFQEDPSRMLFVGNPAAAGAGVTLHAASDAIYVSFSNQAAHYLQSLDRIHRRGQRAKEVNYYLLVCKNTIEENEVVRLRGKELQQHSLLGDHIQWPTSLDDALKELRGH